MQKLNELRMTLIILLIGIFFISGCFFNSNYTVTFKTNGGTEVKNVTVKSGSKLSDIETPKKDGYVFEGWFLDGEEFDINTKIEEDITLVAKWSKESYNTEDTNDEGEDDTTTTTTTNEVTTTKSKTSTTSTKAKGTTNTTKKKTTTTTTKKATTTSTTTTTTADLSQSNPDDENNNDNDKDDSQENNPNEKEDDPDSIDVGIRIDIVGIDPLPEDEEESLEDINVEDENDKHDDVQEDEENSRHLGYIKISKVEDISDSNVKSSLDKEKIEILISEFDKWENITSNRGNIYDVTDGYTTLVTDDVLKLNGDIDLTSFTIIFEDTSYAFELIDDTWYITLATASLEIEGVMGITYYNNLETAIIVANEKKLQIENAKQIITIYADQEIDSPLYINHSLTIVGYDKLDGRYVISNEEEYLFDLTNIVLEDDADFVFELKNIDFKVDKFINLGNVDIENIKLSDVTITINDDNNKEELSDLFTSNDVTVYSFL